MANMLTSFFGGVNLYTEHYQYASEAGKIDRKLDPLEHLLLGIKILTKIKDKKSDPFYKTNYKKLKKDVDHALRIASEKGIAIAHYYRAEALTYFSKTNENTDLIYSYYEKAKKAKKTEQNFRNDFNDWVPQLADELKSTTYKSVLDDLNSKLSKIKKETDPTIIKKEVAKDATLSKEKGALLYKLARVENDSVQYYLLAACCGDTDAQSKIKSFTNKYPDLMEHVTVIKRAIKNATTHKKQYNIVHCYLAIYNIYHYFHSKDLQGKLGKGDQITRQLCFLEDLKAFSSGQYKTNNKTTMFTGVKSVSTYIDVSGNDKNITNYELAWLWRGTQDFQSLRVALAKARAYTSVDALQKAAHCFSTHFDSKATIEGHLMQKIFNNVALLMSEDSDDKDELQSDSESSNQGL